MIWFLIISIYAAPPDAMSYDGPWVVRLTNMEAQPFRTMADCRNAAIEKIARLHEGMMAPMRYRCVPMAARLPAGARR